MTPDPAPSQRPSDCEACDQAEIPVLRRGEEMIYAERLIRNHHALLADLKSEVERLRGDNETLKSALRFIPTLRLNPEILDAMGHEEEAKAARILVEQGKAVLVRRALKGGT